MALPAQNAETTLQLTKTLSAPRDQVFAALTDPEKLKQWHAPSPEFKTPLAEVDLKIGGAYRLTMQSPDGVDHTVVGKYLEVQAPEKLVYTWSWEGSEMEPSETRVTIELFDKNGQTELVLTHELFPSLEATTKHTEGWTGCLAQLEKFVA